MREIIGWGVGLVGTLCAIFFGVKGNRRSDNEAIKKDAVALARIEDKLDTMKSGIDDIRFELRSHRERLNDIDVRLVRVEEATKSAHKRLDTMENKE